MKKITINDAPITHYSDNNHSNKISDNVIHEKDLLGVIMYVLELHNTTIKTMSFVFMMLILLIMVIAINLK